MPSLRGVGGSHERNHPHDELRAQQPSCCSQSNPAANIDPANNPTQNRHPLLPRNHSHPVILAPSRRIRRQELRQARRERQIAYPRRHQSPDDARASPGRQREGQAGGQGGPGVQDRKRKTQHRKAGEIALQLLLMAKSC